MCNILKDILQNITLGDPLLYKNMAVFPIISGELTDLNYLTLDEALEQEKITFEEVSEAGRINCIKAINKGPEMVLILDGEELVGAKQNRIINVSILVPGKTTLEIPVSCVECGRWSYRGRDFRSKREHAFYRLRSDYYEDIQRSLKERGEYATDQGKVWNYIRAGARAHSVHSPTMAMSDVYEHTTHSWQEYVSSFRPIKGQTGFLVMLNGVVAGIELFGKSETLKKVFEKLMKSYAFSAMDASKPSQKYTFAKETAIEFIKAINSSEMETRPSIGLGEDIRFEEKDLIGAALVFEENPLHICAFRKTIAV